MSTRYISDAFLEIRSARLPRQNGFMSGAEFQSFHGELVRANDAIEESSIYAFEASALSAAADLRVDTPQRVDRLVRAVLAQPRRVFLECRTRDKEGCLSVLRGFSDHSSRSGEVHDPSHRFGCFVDILGQGKAILRPVWMHSRQETFSDPHIARFNELAATRGSPAIQKIVRSGTRLTIAPDAVLIDADRVSAISKAEFTRALERITPGKDPLLDRARAAVEKAKGPRARAQQSDHYWRMLRFRDLMDYRSNALDSGPVPMITQPGNAIGDRLRALYPGSMLDPLSEGLHVIAMLALLEADIDDIFVRPARGAKKTRSSTGKHIEKNSLKGSDTRPGSLSIVSLNIADIGLRKLYSGQSEDGETKDSTDTPGDHRSRARHPVRGHLFLARNGRLVYRRPHWRGSREVRTIHRVIAPNTSAGADQT